MITHIDHLGLAIADRQRAIAFFEGTLRMPVYAIATDPTSGLKNGLIRVGETDLVIQQPPKEGTDPEARRDYLPPRDPSPLRQVEQGLHLDTAVFKKYLAKYGEGLHHIGVRVRDLHGAWRHLKQQGLRLLDDLDRDERPGIRDSQLFFPDPQGTHGVLLQFTARPETASLVWQDGTGGWADALGGQPPPASPLYERIDHIGILVEDVPAATAFFANVLQLTPLDGSTAAGRPWALLQIGGSALLLRDVRYDPGAGHPLSRSRPRRAKGLHYLALRCPSLAQVREVLSSAGATVVDSPDARGERDPAFFLDPAGAHGILFGFVGEP